MSKLGNTSGKEVVKAFSKAGWQPVGQVGSHLVMTKPGQRANLSIPQHKELSVGYAARSDSSVRHDSGRVLRTTVAPLCRF